MGAFDRLPTLATRPAPNLQKSATPSRLTQKDARDKDDVAKLKNVPAPKQCAHCRAPIQRRYASARTFCGRACFAAAQSGKRLRARAICRLCGKEAPCHGQKSCSAKCAYTLRKLKTRKPLRCQVCQREYWSKGQIRLKYCSRRCYRTATAAQAFETFACARCAKSVTRRKVRTRQRLTRFCSRECAQAFLVGARHSLWRGGGNPNRGAGWVKLAAQIRQRDAYVCQRCGRTQEENREALAVDHIRPWRSFRNKREANHPKNLVSLCKKCHGYKTTKIERAWLKGDVLAMQQYEKAVAVNA